MESDYLNRKKKKGRYVSLVVASIFDVRPFHKKCFTTENYQLLRHFDGMRKGVI